MNPMSAMSLGGSLLVLALTGCGASAAGTDGQAFSLYTHCGIGVMSYEGRWYERVGGLLDDGQGNPPAGWGNPYQRGTLARNGARLVFQDEAGHREVFRPRPATASPPPTCS